MKNQQFGDMLRCLMRERGVSLAEVGAAVDKGPQTVHKWTNGSEPDRETLLALAQYFDIDWVTLLHGERALEELCADISRRQGRERSAAPSRLRRPLHYRVELGLWRRDLGTDSLHWCPVSWQLMAGRDGPTLWIENGAKFLFEHILEEDHAHVRRQFKIARIDRHNLYLSRFRAKHDPHRWLNSVAMTEDTKRWGGLVVGYIMPEENAVNLATQFEVLRQEYEAQQKGQSEDCSKRR